MDKDIKILIVPDIHGREFWKEPVKTVLENSDAEIVFLGDYHDPYPDEFDADWELDANASTEYLDTSINNFKEIIDLKKQYTDRITLLLGNHDCTYAISRDICQCRTDYLHFAEIKKLFIENKELFQIAKEETINGKHFIFSHAGMLREFFNFFLEEIDWDKINPVEYLNNAWEVGDYNVLDKLGVYDRCRGACLGNKYGSPVWSDIRMWPHIKAEETFGYNIVGHTQLSSPLVFETIACLDCRQCFYLNSEGQIVDYNNDEILKPTEV